MRKDLITLLAVSGIVLMTLPQVAFSQEGAPTEYETTDPERERYERERIISSPGEGDYRYTPPASTHAVTPSTPRDTVAAAPVTRTPPVEADKEPEAKPEAPIKPPAEKQLPARGEDDSILSFNFLYYIIQKYKLQDIID